MNALRQTENKQETSRGPLPGLLRPPIIFLAAILLGIALNRAWPLHFVPSDLEWLGSLVIFCAVLLFLLSFREFRAAGTPVPGSERTTTIVRTGPYRLSRNPIYLSFVLLVSFVERPLAAHDARSGCRPDRSHCDPENSRKTKNCQCARLRVRKGASEE
jgi:protein-S-isoprenylcysteine O-methyltransferase Ste14